MTRFGRVEKVTSAEQHELSEEGDTPRKLLAVEVSTGLATTRRSRGDRKSLKPQHNQYKATRNVQIHY
jgi:hypothetical protein